jgi:hypothetical protein
MAAKLAMCNGSMKISMKTQSVSAAMAKAVNIQWRNGSVMPANVINISSLINES